MPGLSDFSVYSALLPILAVLFLHKKVNKWPIWVILIYSIYSFLNDLSILYLAKTNTNIKILLYYYTLIEYLLFTILLLLIIRSKFFKKIFIFISISFACFCVYWILIGNFTRFDSLQTSIECIIIIITCLFYLYEQLTKPQVEFIHSNYKFWIVISLLIYLAGVFFLFAYAADLPKKENEKYWPILHICNIIKNLLFAVAIYISSRPEDIEETYYSQS